MCIIVHERAHKVRTRRAMRCDARATPRSAARRVMLICVGVRAALAQIVVETLAKKRLARVRTMYVLLYYIVHMCVLL